MMSYPRNLYLSTESDSYVMDNMTFRSWFPYLVAAYRTMKNPTLMAAAKEGRVMMVVVVPGTKSAARA
ncbi:MAG: hypothetical protein AAB817_01945 [Patescibacteria group bacterium]